MSTDVYRENDRTVSIRVRLRRQKLKQLGHNWRLLVMIALPLVWLIVFRYGPMYGAQIAFRNFSPARGIVGSPWVGLRYFHRFLTSPLFSRVFLNTLIISFYSLAAGFPFPIILALALHYTSTRWFKKSVQTVSYIPHFISTVVIVGILVLVLNPRDGLVNQIIGALGGRSLYFLAEPKMFRSIYVWSNVWQHVGFGSVIYLAALSSIDPQLHEAAIIDGATRVQRITHIDIPGIMPTAIIVLIVSFGGIMSVGFEKIFLMQNDLNLSMSEVIDTYVYKIGIASAGANFSYGAAVGLFQSVVGFLMVAIVNRIARHLSSSSLW
jgi:putative aldouronate transport system permease protein